MQTNIVILLTSLTIAAVWAATICLCLVRHFRGPATLRRSNRIVVILMIANLLLVCLLYCLGQPIGWLTIQIKLWALITDSLVIAGLLVFCSVVGAARMRPLPTVGDFIIILGAGLNKGRIPPLLAARLDQGRKLWLFMPAARIIATGGRVHGAATAEATAMGDYLKRQGVPARQIIYEDRALNTWQNLRNSLALVDQLTNNVAAKRLIVVTSSFHVPRAASYARQQGRRLAFVAAPTPWQYFPLAVVRDYLGTVRDHRRLASLILVIGLVIGEVALL